MAKTVAELSTDELRGLIEEVVEETLIELLGDPDEGLELRPEIRARLERQRRQVAAGERGRPLQEVLEELDLT